MEVFTDADLASLLPYDELIDHLRKAFRRGGQVPPRQVYTLGDKESSRLFGSMAASQEGAGIVFKLLTAFPANAEKGLPVLHTVVVLFDDRTGAPLGVFDGHGITRRRTAAASALAADYLARPDAKTLLVVGIGQQASYMAAAHATVRKIGRVLVWGRDLKKAPRVVEKIQNELGGAVATDVARDLEEAVRVADIITCATSSPDPLVRGEWLRAGTHVDLVGSFSPDMRESDDRLMQRARIYLDTRDACMAEAGDILIPLNNGVIKKSDIVGDLFDLTRAKVPGRQTSDEITLFKSVGTAIEDLAAADLACRKLGLMKPLTRPGPA